MQNEKDENSRIFLKFNPLEIFFGKKVYETGMNPSDFLENSEFAEKEINRMFESGD